MTKSSEAPDDPAPFQPLGKFNCPSLPAQETLCRWLGRLNGIFSSSDKPLIADDHPRKTTRDLLDAVVAPPACGPLERELENTPAASIEDAQPASWLKLIVVPPCDQNQLIRGGAERHDHAALERPTRDAILSAATLDPKLPASTGMLVIPRLEDWFIRHHRG